MKATLFLALIAAASAACAGQWPKPAPIPREQGLYRCQIHRGGGKKSRPDNSMETFLWCWGLGFAPEVDARLTKDGVAIAMHDDDFKRIGRGISPEFAERKIADMTWAEVRDVDTGSYLGPHYATTRLATMETIFSAMKDRPERLLYVDEKGAPPEMIAGLAERYGVIEQTYYCSWNWRKVVAWRKIAPKGRSMVWLGNFPKDNSPENIAKTEAFVQGKLDEMARTGFDGIDMVQIHVRTDLTKEDPFCPSTPFIRKAVETLHGYGVVANCITWTEGTNADVHRRLWDLGFDIFTSDYPEFFGEFAKTLVADDARSALGIDRDRLLLWLRALPGKSEKKLLSGQQCDHYPRILKKGLSDLEKVHEKTGKWPAIGGFDYFEPKGVKSEPELFKPARWREVNPFIKRYAAKGGLITLCAHLPNPWTGSNAWDGSERNRLAELRQRGTAARKAYNKMIGGCADGLEDLQKAGIVVLWRPFHELEGEWFWWGGEGKGGERAAILKELWREMHDYMTRKRGLKNLIWVFNGNACHYPGDDVVDLNSADIYTDKIGEKLAKALPRLASADKKPFALAEFGPNWKEGMTECYDYANFADEVLSAAPGCVYFLAWHEPWSLWYNDNADKLMSHPAVLTLEDVVAEFAQPKR